MMKQLTIESEEIKELTKKQVKLVIEQDTDCSSPRDGGSLGIMISKHKNYNLGDVEQSKDFFNNYYDHELDSWDTVEIKLMKDYDAYIILPLYLYDHSGITINTTGFSCKRDSGKVGYIYVTRDRILKEFNVKRVSKKLKEKITKYLVNEVKTYDDYLTGNVYGYQLIDSLTNEELDSCWGFYGYDYKTNGILDNINQNKFNIIEVITK